MLISYIIVKQCQNWDIDISTTHRAYSDFTSYARTQLCVCLQLYAMLSHVVLCKPHHNQIHTCTDTISLSHATPLSTAPSSHLPNLETTNLFSISVIIISWNH